MGVQAQSSRPPSYPPFPLAFLREYLAEQILKLIFGGISHRCREAWPRNVKPTEHFKALLAADPEQLAGRATFGLPTTQSPVWCGPAGKVAMDILREYARDLQAQCPWNRQQSLVPQRVPLGSLHYGKRLCRGIRHLAPYFQSRGSTETAANLQSWYESLALWINKGAAPGTGKR